MADYQTIKVTLGQVTTNTGKVCKNPIIKLEGYPNIYINCVDPSCGLYELQLPDNEDPKCLIFSVSCDLGECPTCDTQLIKKCFCEDTGDCPDCNICIKKPGETSGFCEPLCDAAHCCDGACRECCESKQCPCNQVCNANGNCVCPPGTFIGPDNECCIECDSTHPCPPCHECIGGKCEPIDCPDGICDPTTGTCVDCITGDQCDENECCEDNKCVCCEGFVRNNCTGECVPLPPNACTSSSDCPVCSECRNFDPCTGVGSCLPTTCPPGKVPVDVDGVCRCLTECDCDDPDCPNVTDGCNDFVDVCACLPCEGDCASGCEDPCYCNPQTNRCEQNPCVNVSCRTGLDCGEGCGCDTSTGTCVPCATLDCVGSNAKCEQVLGCGCVGNRCEDEDCDNIPCSTYSDCPFGCTCDKGKCVSCSNFPCPVDCANQPGCGCVGNECEGAEEECEDELTLEKNDDNCTLTGKLIKDNCCQCSPLTLDIKGQTISQTTDSAVISFIAEGRKGAFNGDVNANPKLDEFSNPNIASSGVANDTPLSGTFTLNYTVYYNLLSLETGAIIGRTQNTLPGGSATFAANTATATFANVTLPKIGSRTTTDTNIKVVTEIRLTFRLTSAISIANNCVYNSGATIEYRIQSSSGLSAFSTSGYGNGRGTEVTSSSCRYPFFKWSKDGQLFRKVYVPGGPTYTDTLTKQLGLESCKTYLLETDCNCKDPISKYIVFCNPSDLDFTVDPNSCGKCITINSFDTCDVNEDKEFYVTGGSLNIKWIGDNAPIGQKMCSTTTIDQLKFGLTCDVQNQCTKTYNIEGTDLEITPDISECEPDSTEFTVVFPDTDDNGTCLVDYIKVGGHTLTDINDFSKKLAIGKYTATVYWKCGCDPTEVTFEQDCCDGAVDDISRQCNGAIICEQDPSVVYKLVTGTTKSVLNDVCGYVSNLGPNDSVVIEAQRGNCTPVTKVIPALGTSCCEDFQVLINQISANVAEVMVVGGTNYVLTAVNTTSGNPVNISQNGPQGHYTVSGYVEGDNIVVTATDQSCPVEIAVFEAGGCSLSVLMEEYEEDNRCRLKASVEGLACQCNLGQYIVSINEGGISDNGTSFTIPYTTSFMGFDDILPVEGSLHAGREGSIFNQGFITGTGSITVQKEQVSSLNCISSNITMTMGETANMSGNTTIGVTVKQGTTHLINLPNIASVSVKINGVNAINNGVNVYEVPNCCQSGIAASVLVTVVDTDGKTYTGNTIQSLVLGQSVTNNVNICEPVQNSNSNIPLEFTVYGLKFEDNCSYHDVSLYFVITPTGVILPNPTSSIGLVPIDPDAKFVKFTWYTEGVELHDEFVGSAQNYTSYLPLDLSVVGSPYDVIAECLPCIDGDSKELCCLPELFADTINGCNVSADLTFIGNPGDYQIIYEGEAFDFTIDGSLNATVNITGAGGGELSETNYILKVKGAFGCEETKSLTLVVPCTYGISTVCTTGSLYDITVSGCPGSVITIESGAGVVNDQIIEDADENDPPTIKITTGDSCEQIVGPILPVPGCIAPSPTPTATPTATPSSTPDPAATATPTPTSSPVPPPTSSPTPSPSPNPAATATPTPTAGGCTNSGTTFRYLSLGPCSGGHPTLKLKSPGDSLPRTTYNSCCGVTNVSCTWEITGPGGYYKTGTATEINGQITRTSIQASANIPNQDILCSGSPGVYNVKYVWNFQSTTCGNFQRTTTTVGVTVLDTDFTACGCSSPTATPPPAATPTPPPAATPTPVPPTPTPVSCQHGTVRLTVQNDETFFYCCQENGSCASSGLIIAYNECCGPPTVTSNTIHVTGPNGFDYTGSDDFVLTTGPISGTYRLHWSPPNDSGLQIHNLEVGTYQVSAILHWTTPNCGALSFQYLATYQLTETRKTVHCPGPA